MKKVVIITGASRGIGASCAKLLDAHGYEVVKVSLHKKDARSLICDVQKEPSVKSTVQKILKKYKRIDALVNCAGVVSFSSSLKTTQTEWERVMGVNLLGTYYFSKHVIPQMKKQKSGRIVNISSIAGRLYSRMASLPYTCSKYAVIGLTKQMAAEFAQDGITINCLCPSQTKTDMISKNFSQSQIEQMIKKIPVGRLAHPSEIAHVIHFLLSEQASYMNGSIIDVNGGQL
ncbi:MAG: SDR family NAD(P)-dependent oxidoreductase [Elusimicrobiota bacterium]